MEILKSLSTSAVVITLEHVFSQYGIPHVLISDNGPPFSGQLFTSYLAQQGIQYRRVTPYWPQASGETERFMRTIQKTIGAACSEGKGRKREVNNFFINLTRKAVQPTVKVGDRVLFKAPKVNKPSTPYHPEPFTVVHKKSTMVTVKGANDQFLPHIKKEAGR